MKFQIDYSFINSYKRLPYEPWYAIAEFIDNSTQSYINNKSVLDKAFELTGKKLCINIIYDRVKGFIRIEDNSIGMDENDLTRALNLGKPPENPMGRSRYGLGMKTAAFWFGDQWTIKTKKMGQNVGYKVTLDIDKISNNNIELDTTSFDDIESSHYTIITIYKLNKKFKGRTLGKIIDYLGSMYRFDFQDFGLELYWNNHQMTWESFDQRLHVTSDGVRFKQAFQFPINGKTVSGWVGVLGKGFGSRKHAGFSIIQNRRVIQGWPHSYKPSSIFGDQDEGINDLVNQRVIGEIFLEGFSVSHTKDKIAWEDDEEEILDNLLGEYCKSAKEMATTLRFSKDNQDDTLSIYKDEAISIFESEIHSKEIDNFIRTVQPAPEKIIQSAYSKSSKKIIEDIYPALEVEIGSDGDTIYVQVYFNEKSEFEPYVLTETTVTENKVLVIINVIHPQFQEMSSSDVVLNFIRHCVYDGVAEWKAIKLRGELAPYTIRFIKDGLLRIPFEIKRNKGM